MSAHLVQCIGCRQFTVQARGMPNLVEVDKKMAAVGMGRCRSNPEPHLWLSASYARDCPRYDAVPEAELRGRQCHLVKLREKGKA